MRDQTLFLKCDVCGKTETFDSSTGTVFQSEWTQSWERYRRNGHNWTVQIDYCADCWAAYIDNLNVTPTDDGPIDDSLDL